MRGRATESWVRLAFRRERAIFARRFPTPALVRATLVLHAVDCPQGARTCALRDLAWATWEPDGSGRVHVLTRALGRGRANVLGLLRHEFGHLADADPDAPGAEQRADDLARAACGSLIRYDASDVQTVGDGRYPRPLHLHR